MGSTAEQVRRCIEEDVFLQEALARGIVNYNKMARWLQEHRDLNGTESNIAQAIPRNEPESGSQVMADAWESLRNARVDHRGGLGALDMEMTETAVDSLDDVLATAEPERGGSFQVLHDDSSMTVILDADVVERAREAFDDPSVVRTFTGLSELRIVPGQGDELHPAAGSLAVACLAVNGRQPRFTIDGISALSIFVDEADSREAFDLLERLRS